MYSINAYRIIFADLSKEIYTAKFSSLFFEDRLIYFCLGWL